MINGGYPLPGTESTSTSVAERKMPKGYEFVSIAELKRRKRALNEKWNNKIPENSWMSSDRWTGKDYRQLESQRETEEALAIYREMKKEEERKRAAWRATDLDDWITLGPTDTIEGGIYKRDALKRKAEALKRLAAIRARYRPGKVLGPKKVFRNSYASNAWKRKKEAQRRLAITRARYSRQ